MAISKINSMMAPESAGLHIPELASQPAYRKCRACLYDSRHPFGLTFDETGLCSGCITHNEKTSLNWKDRFAQLNKLVQPHRGRKGGYDCVIPVRGTAEYFYVVDVVKNQLGLNPLLVAFNSQFNSTVGIENLDLIRDTFNCDVLLKTQSPQTYRKLIRETLSRFGSVHWPFLAGHTVWPVRVAVQHKIPLIVWPVHQPTEQAGMYSYLDENEMTRRSRHEHDLMRVEAHELCSVESLIGGHDVLTSLYPSDLELAATGVRGIYLSNYIPWDRRLNSENAVNRFGARAAVCPGTFDTYDHVDNLLYMSVHDAIKRRKLGYGRVRDHLCQEIRFGRVSRTDATAVEFLYDREFSITDGNIKLKQMFYEWMEMNPQGFDWLMDYHFGVTKTEGKSNPIYISEASRSFTEGYNTTAEPIVNDNKYILIGKGLTL